MHMRTDYNLSPKHVFRASYLWNRDNTDVPDPTFSLRTHQKMNSARRTIGPRTGLRFGSEVLTQPISVTTAMIMAKGWSKANP